MLSFVLANKQHLVSHNKWTALSMRFLPAKLGFIFYNIAIWQIKLRFGRSKRGLPGSLSLDNPIDIVNLSQHENWRPLIEMYKKFKQINDCPCLSYVGTDYFQTQQVLWLAVLTPHQIKSSACRKVRIRLFCILHFCAQQNIFSYSELFVLGEISRDILGPSEARGLGRLQPPQ